MPITYTLIASNTLTTSAASVTFSAIPNTFTDLVLRYSARSDRGGGQDIDYPLIRFSSDTATNYTSIWMRGDGSNNASGSVGPLSSLYAGMMNAAATTSNTFNSEEIYIPNYLASANKPISLFSALENNATTAYLFAQAGLWRNATAVSSISLTSSSASNFVSGSSFFLYGIKKD